MPPFPRFAIPSPRHSDVNKNGRLRMCRSRECGRSKSACSVADQSPCFMRELCTCAYRPREAGPVTKMATLNGQCSMHTAHERWANYSRYKELPMFVGPVASGRHYRIAIKVPGQTQCRKLWGDWALGLYNIASDWV